MVRIRAYSLVMSLPFLLALAGGVLFISSSALAAYGHFVFLVAILLQGVLALVVACPRCGKSPYGVAPHWGPFSWGGKPLPDSICSKCGHDFTAKMPAQEVGQGDGAGPTP